VLRSKVSGIEVECECDRFEQSLTEGEAGMLERGELGEVLVE